MNSLKQCKDCKGWLPENDEFFYRHGDGYRFSPYCKPCHRIRTYRSVKVQRDRRREAGISVKASVAALEEAIDTRDSNKYLDRHLQKREQEAELGESLMREKRGASTDAGEYLDLNNPPPVYRDLTNGFLRPQVKRFCWRVA